MVEAVNEDLKNYDYFKDQAVFKLFVKHAFTKEGKLLLPEGIPPYKADESPYPISQGNFNHVIAKLYILQRPDLSKIKRETIYVDMLENINHKEAALLVAIANQSVDTLFPLLTHENMAAIGAIDQSEVTIDDNDDTMVVHNKSADSIDNDSVDSVDSVDGDGIKHIVRLVRKNGYKVEKTITSPV